jgi:hypothetical protein
MEAEDPVPVTTQKDVQPTERPMPLSSTDETITIASVPSASNLKRKLQQDTITFHKKHNLS